MRWLRVVARLERSRVDLLRELFANTYWKAGAWRERR